MGYSHFYLFRCVYIFLSRSLAKRKTIQTLNSVQTFPQTKYLKRFFSFFRKIDPEAANLQKLPRPVEFSHTSSIALFYVKFGTYPLTRFQVLSLLSKAIINHSAYRGSNKQVKKFYYTSSFLNLMYNTHPFQAPQQFDGTNTPRLFLLSPYRLITSQLVNVHHLIEIHQVLDHNHYQEPQFSSDAL